jgi:hypothetical protein
VGTFIDRHPADVVPEEALARMLREAEERLVDPHRVRSVGQWLGDGCLHCVLEAPGPDAVRQHHTALGMPCDDLHEIEGLQGTWPVSAQDEQLVRASIARFWPPAAA